MSTTGKIQQQDEEAVESSRVSPLSEQEPEVADSTTPDGASESQRDSQEHPDVRVPVTMSTEGREVLRDKMKDMFAGFISDIDGRVLEVCRSQCELDSQLDQLIATLDSIRIDEKLTRDISENAKRIASLKSRLTVIHTILSDSSTRCSRTLAACGAALQNRSPTGSGAPPQPQPQPQQTTTATTSSNQTDTDN